MKIQSLLSLDPATVLLDLCLLVLLSLLIWAIVAAVITLRDIKNYPLRKAQELERSSRKESRSMLGGLIIADIFSWIVLRQRFGAVLSVPVLIAILVGVDLFFLFFIGWEWMSVVLTRKRIRFLLTHPSEGIPADVESDKTEQI